MAGNENFVEFAERICSVTGKKYKADELLMNMHLKAIPEDERLIGWGISPEVQEKMDEGYVPLVCIDVDKSDMADGTTTPAGAHRTGEIAYVRKTLLEQIVDEPINHAFSFIDKGFLDLLNAMPTREEKTDE